MRVPTLLTPLKYVLIRHSTRVSYNLVAPAIGSVIMTILIVVWPGNVAILGEKGYLSQIQNLMTVLGGFFVAALTLITTNQNPVLLGPVGGKNPPALRSESKPLSRRRFLAYLFGYLAFSSFGLVAVSIFGNMIASAALNFVKSGARWWIELILMSAYNFWLSHIAVATLLGLFYFTERLQVADAVVRAKKPGAKPTPAE